MSRGGSRRGGFGPTVLLGLAGAGLAAVAGNRAWAVVDDDGSASTAIAAVSASAQQASAPLVTSLALVALAAWGVVLVTRGRFRRVVVWLLAVASLGLVVAAVSAWLVAAQQVGDAVDDASVSVHRTVWAYLGVVVALAALVAAVGAVRGVAGWPEMGRRYDAPTGTPTGTGAGPGRGDGGAGAAAVTPAEDQSHLDLWRAIDEGRDPTEPPAH